MSPTCPARIPALDSALFRCLRRLIAILAVYFFWLMGSAYSEEALVRVAADGRLVYGPYANRGEEEKLNMLPDFSRCGFGGGGVSLPRGIAIREEIEPSESDQREVIQSAIDRVSALPLGEDGFRGAILLKAGKHFVEGSLLVQADGVVLLGEGQNLAENGGTELVATLAEQHNFIRIEGSSEVRYGGKHTLLDEYLATGERRLRVEGAESFEVGERIQIMMTPNDHWVETLGTDEFGWVASEYQIPYERTIEAIEGDALVLDSPLVQPIRSIYGGGFVRSFDPVGRVRNCGVENMVITSNYAGEEDENHGWIAVFLSRAENCWVRKVTSRYFGYSCVTLSASVFCTVEECAALDPKSQLTGGRRYSFYIEQASSFNLIQRCYTRGGRHDVVTGSRVPGPNVFVDVFIDGNHSDPGPHHRYASGILFDNIQATGVGMRVENRKTSGTGHGWSGAQIVFWNCKARDFVCDAPPTAMNFAFGFDGSQREGSWAPEEPSGIVEPGDPHVQPRSLYYAQMKDRLGMDAVLQVADWRQVTGSIWSELQEWKGLGELSSVGAVPSATSLGRWLEERGFADKAELFPGTGMTAGEAFVSGVDLLGGVPLRLDDFAFAAENGLLVETQLRLGLEEGKVVFEASSDLTAWGNMNEQSALLLLDDVLEVGVRKQSWFVSDLKDGPRFFRLRMAGL